MVVLSFEQWESMLDRKAVIELYAPPPLLVMEIVRNSTQSQGYLESHCLKMENTNQEKHLEGKIELSLGYFQP